MALAWQAVSWQKLNQYLFIYPMADIISLGRLCKFFSSTEVTIFLITQLGILSLFLTFSLFPKGCPLSCLLLWVGKMYCVALSRALKVIPSSFSVGGVVAYSSCVPFFFGWYLLDSMVWVRLVLQTQLSVVRCKISLNLYKKRHSINFICAKKGWLIQYIGC